MSPLLFLLAAEGLSQLIYAAKRRGDINGIEVDINLQITHLLFVDDILLFSSGSRSEIGTLKQIIDLFLTTTGVIINFSKSVIIAEGLSSDDIRRTVEELPFKVKGLEDNLNISVLLSSLTHIKL